MHRAIYVSYILHDISKLSKFPGKPPEVISEIIGQGRIAPVDFLEPVEQGKDRVYPQNFGQAYPERWGHKGSREKSFGERPVQNAFFWGPPSIGYKQVHLNLHCILDLKGPNTPRRSGLKL